MIEFLKYRKKIKKLRLLRHQIFSIEMELGYGTATARDSELKNTLTEHKKEYRKLEVELINKVLLKGGN